MDDSSKFLIEKRLQCLNIALDFVKNCSNNGKDVIEIAKELMDFVYADLQH